MKRLASRYVYESAWTRLRVDQVELADGSRTDYDIVEKPNAVLILATRPNQLLMVRQYRYPVDDWVWEFPSGAREPGESVEATARRELLEETGCIAGQVRLLNFLYEVPSFAPHGFHIVEASIIETVEAQPEIREADISSSWFDLETIGKMALRGDILDAPSLAALSIYLLRRKGLS